MDSGRQKNVNKEVINQIRDKQEQIEETMEGISHITWRIENRQPYESLKVLIKVKLDLRKSLKIRQKELKQLQGNLVIS